ncbi:MAG: hypothetical protein AAFZ04_12515 [Pseudomonadota bacterium]
MRYFYTVALVACLGLTAPSAAHANACQALAGSWSGTMSGKFKGATSMTVKPNCRLSWQLPDGRINNCNYRSVDGVVEYKCSLGSHGVAQVSASKITMQNVFTAMRHGAYTVNWTKD